MPTDTNQSPLLALPLKIRLKILRHTGLVRSGCAIGFMEEPNRLHTWYGWYRLGYPPSTHRRCDSDQSLTQYTHHQRKLPFEGYCRHEPLPVELFSVCSQLRDECERIMYGENTFYVTVGSPNAGEILRNIRTLAWSRIRQLDVVLGSLDFLYPSGLMFKRSDMTETQRWPRICNLLAERMHANRTSLGVYSFMKSERDLERTLRPLKQVQMPYLRHFRLSTIYQSHPIDERPDAEFQTRTQEMIRHVAKQMIGTTATHFPLKKLPSEVRMMVLSHIGLKQDPMPIRRDWWLKYNNGRMRMVGRQPLHCCGYCNVRTRVCQCPPEHGITYSTSCRCSIEKALLEIDETQVGPEQNLGYEAKLVYFSQNRFFLDSGDVPSTLRDFLMIPPEYLKRIRDIRIVIGPLSEHNHQFCEIDLLNRRWDLLLRFIASRMALSKTSIEILLHLGIWGSREWRDWIGASIAERVKKSALRNVTLAIMDDSKDGWHIRPPQILFRRQATLNGDFGRI
jgi:hypothetical protein